MLDIDDKMRQQLFGILAERIEVEQRVRQPDFGWCYQPFFHGLEIDCRRLYKDGEMVMEQHIGAHAFAEDCDIGDYNGTGEWMETITAYTGENIAGKGMTIFLCRNPSLTVEDAIGPNPKPQPVFLRASRPANTRGKFKLERGDALAKPFPLFGADMERHRKKPR